MTTSSLAALPASTCLGSALKPTGYMTSGDYQQVEGYKAVIDWLNGRTKAYTDHTRSIEVKADWANGKVATTGLSYLGTMSNALATTGVDGLEVVIAEAGISSWYDYYRENGLVTSPGGIRRGSGQLDRPDLLQESASR